MSGPIEEISRALPLHEALKEWVPADLWAEYESAQASLRNLSRPCWLNWSGSRQGWLNAQVDFDARRKRLADELRRAQQAIKYHFDGKVRCGELIIYLTHDFIGENPRRLRANAWSSIEYGFNANQIRAPGGKTLFAHVTQASPEIRQAHTECSSEPRPHKSVAGGLAQEQLATSAPAMLEVADDADNFKILVRPINLASVTGNGFVEMGGAHYHLLKQLVEARSKDQEVGRSADSYQLRDWQKLAPNAQSKTHFTKTIFRCRGTFADRYRQRFVVEPASDLLIENVPGQGYRLGRAVRVISPSEFD